MQFLKEGTQRNFCEVRGTGRYRLTHEEFVGDLWVSQMEGDTNR